MENKIQLIKEKINDLDLEKCNDSQVEDILRKAANVGFLQIELHSNISITRARIGFDFKYVQDFSYNPTPSNNYNRANLPNQSMFYGNIAVKDASPDSYYKNLSNSRYVTMLETTSFIYDTNTTASERITFSQWNVIHPINLIIMCHPTMFPDVANNFLLQDMKKNYNLFLHNVPNDRFDVKELDAKMKFFSEEFAKPIKATENYKYKITANLSNILLQKEYIDGIVFPSVKAEGDYSLNVAIKPSIVDQRMKLDYVVEYQKDVENGGIQISPIRKGIVFNEKIVYDK